MKAVDLDSSFEYSNTIQLVTRNGQLATRFFPNPVSDVLNIEISTPTIIQITNINGQILKEQQIQNSQAISVKDLPNGIYYIKAGQDFQKLIIQR